jgi:hypothetical protein
MNLSPPNGEHPVSETSLDDMDVRPPEAEPSFRFTRDSSSGRQPLPHLPSEEGQVVRNSLGATGAMAPDAGNDGERAMTQVLQLGLVIGDSEVQVGLTRHQEDPCPDSGEGRSEITVVHRTSADVGLLPGDRCGVEVGRVDLGE